MPRAVRELVARNIRFLKGQRDLTWDQLAASVGVSQRQVYRWGKAEQLPSPENLRRLAVLFDVSNGYLLEDHKESRRA